MSKGRWTLRWALFVTREVGRTLSRGEILLHSLSLFVSFFLSLSLALHLWGAILVTNLETVATGTLGARSWRSRNSFPASLITSRCCCWFFYSFYIRRPIFCTFRKLLEMLLRYFIFWEIKFSYNFNNNIQLLLLSLFLLLLQFWEKLIYKNLRMKKSKNNSEEIVKKGEKAKFINARQDSKVKGYSRPLPS